MMYFVVKMKDGRVIMFYALGDTGSRYYLGDWQFINKADIEKVLDQFS